MGYSQFLRSSSETDVHSLDALPSALRALLRGAGSSSRSNNGDSSSGGVAGLGMDGAKHEAAAAGGSDGEEASFVASERSAPSLSALGGLLSFLKTALLEHKLLALRRFSLLPGTCSAAERANSCTQSNKEGEGDVSTIRDEECEEGERDEAAGHGSWGEKEGEDDGAFMVLDSCALANLDVLQNSEDGSMKG